MDHYCGPKANKRRKLGGLPACSPRSMRATITARSSTAAAGTSSTAATRLRYNGWTGRPGCTGGPSPRMRAFASQEVLSLSQWAVSPGVRRTGAVVFGFWEPPTVSSTAQVGLSVNGTCSDPPGEICPVLEKLVLALMPTSRRCPNGLMCFDEKNRRSKRSRWCIRAMNAPVNSTCAVAIPVRAKRVLPG